ncbi:hypothetical protein, partial [Ileibacterium valens]|uniref:hypothetical protein n=1 Tax=Ileibacterium valens TaxID=1862668 RepID=UPI00272D83CB
YGAVRGGADTNSAHSTRLTGLRKIFYSPFGILIFIEATVKQDLICKRKSGFRLQQNTRNVCF